VAGARVVPFAAGAGGCDAAGLGAGRARGGSTRLVAVVGRGREAEHVIDLLRHHPELGYRVCGLVGDRDTAEEHDIPWLGGPRHAAEEPVAGGAGGGLLRSARLPSGGVSRRPRSPLTARLP